MTDYPILGRYEFAGMVDGHDKYLADHVPPRLTPEERERLNAIQRGEIGAYIKRKSS